MRIQDPGNTRRRKGKGAPHATPAGPPPSERVPFGKRSARQSLPFSASPWITFSHELCHRLGLTGDKLEVDVHALELALDLADRQQAKPQEPCGP